MAIQSIPSYTSVSQPNATAQTLQMRQRSAIDATSKDGATGQQPASSGAIPAQVATVVGGKQPSQEQIDQAMKEVKQALPFQARDLQFSIDNETGRSVIKIVDPATKEVIRQMPSEELLAITRALDKFTGLLAKQKV